MMYIIYVFSDNKLMNTKALWEFLIIWRNSDHLIITILLFLKYLILHYFENVSHYFVILTHYFVISHCEVIMFFGSLITKTCYFGSYNASKYEWETVILFDWIMFIACSRQIKCVSVMKIKSRQMFLFLY